MDLLIAFAVVGILSYLGVGAMRRLAHAHDILDIPNERSSHTTSVPRGGGVPIVLLTAAGSWLLLLINRVAAPRALVVFTIGAMLIAVVSWLDDLYSISTAIRFLVHSLAAALIIYEVGYLPLRNIMAGNLWAVESVAIAITFIWLVGLTNAYNFMDGIDGIAGSQALIAGLGWAIFSFLNSQRIVASLGVLIAATALGFLVHNWPPAKIFMGDVASAFLGFTLAALPLIYNAQIDPANRALRVPLFGLIVVWPFVFDATFTFFRRLFKGERVFSAHRSHLYQRLNIAGRTHQFVTLLYSMLAAVGTVLALMWIAEVRNAFASLLIVVPLLSVGLLLFVMREEHASRAGLRDNLPAARDRTQLAIDGEP
ncbi:MAG TPA: glycosyltransferase family 4 protein [Pyrinomonadaceae bacterium]|nr:glycosyltransferase family 4 protein [Pyrinomonadaceae bacterium]